MPDDDFTNKTYTIRRAGPDDADALCLLIRELAAFEKLDHEAEPSASQLANQLKRNASPPCGAFLAESADGRPIGFALFYFKYSTFLTDWGIHLEDLFVHEEQRGRGVGRSLMRAVAQNAVQSGCKRLELSVLNWNREAVEFYRNLGAEPLDDWTTFRFSGGSLKTLGRRPIEP